MKEHHKQRQPGWWSRTAGGVRAQRQRAGGAATADGGSTTGGPAHLLGVVHIRATDVGQVGGGGQVIHHSVQQRLHALVLEGGAAAPASMGCMAGAGGHMSGGAGEESCLARSAAQGAAHWCPLCATVWRRSSTSHAPPVGCGTHMGTNLPSRVPLRIRRLMVASSGSSPCGGEEARGRQGCAGSARQAARPRRVCFGSFAAGAARQDR